MMMQTWKRTEQLLCFVLTICTAARRPRPASSAWAGAATWPAAGTWWWRWWTRPPPPPASTPSTPASGESAPLVSTPALLTMTLTTHNTLPPLQGAGVRARLRGRGAGGRARGGGGRLAGGPGQDESFAKTRLPLPFCHSLPAPADCWLTLSVRRCWCGTGAPGSPSSGAPSCRRPSRTGRSTVTTAEILTCY